MSGLPKSIIKKYGVSKKAWVVFRGRKHKTRGLKMARRKHRGFRAFRHKVGSVGVKPLQIDSMLYGAVRARVSSLLDPLVSKIPLGAYADEVGMGLVDYLIAKNMGGMVKDVALKGLVIENARIGETLAAGLMPTTATAGNAGSFILG